MTDTTPYVRQSLINVANGVAGLDGTGKLSAPLPAVGPGATGPIGDGTHVPVVTIDAEGRVTALTSAVITGGGGGAFPDFTGSGNPEGTVSAGAGKVYQDTTNGGLYFKALSTNATFGTAGGWVRALTMDPAFDFFGIPIVGIATTDGSDVTILCDGNSASGFSIKDTLSINGTGNGLSYFTDGTDGDQVFLMQLGNSGQFAWQFNADGSTVFPSNAIIDVSGISAGPASVLKAVIIQAPTSSPWLEIKTGSTGQYNFQFTNDGRFNYNALGPSNMSIVGNNVPSGAYAMTGAESGVISNASVTLPNPSTYGFTAYFIKDSGSGTLVLHPHGSEHIDGASSVSFTAHQGLLVFSDFANWQILASH